VLSATASASTKFTVSAADVNTLRGKTFDMPVRINGNPSIWGILADVSFDKSAFELVGCTTGTVFGEKRFTLQNDLKKNHFTFLAVQDALSDTSANGALLTLKFKVRKKAKARTYAIGVDVRQTIDAKGAVISAKSQNGSVKVGASALKKTDTSGTDTSGDGSPGTGDQFPLALFIAICLIALLCMTLMLRVLYRKRKHKVDGRNS
jgi:hypothetical protein